MINSAGKGDAVGHPARDPYMTFLAKRRLADDHIEDFRKRTQKGGYAATWPTPLPDDAYCDNWIGQNGLDLMKRFPRGKPWHLVVNFAGPHDPEDITVNMEKTCRDRNFPQPNGNTQFAPEVHNAIRQNYTAMVENLDRWVGTYMQELARRGELDNTVVVFSSDHGEMLGDHNRWRKSVPFEASAHVPLVVAGPGIRKGARTDALVNHIDLGATFLDFGGARKSEGMTSQSLRPLLEGRTQSHREHVRAGLGGWRMATDGRYKLVTGFGGAKGVGDIARQRREDTKSDPPLLFDLRNDPGENRNLAEEKKEIVARLSELI
jgi:membrane-anchored protein YejM (alkaline phosphatase superfamily)